MKHSYRSIALFFILILGACSHPKLGREDVLVQELLSKIDSSVYFISKVEAKLAESRGAISQLPPDTQEYIDACISLGKSYRKFCSDSAIVYLDKAAKSAQGLGDELLYYRIMLEKASVLINTGFYYVGNSILQDIPREKLDSSSNIIYINTLKGLYHVVYLNLDSKPLLRAEYVKLYEQYRDSLLMLLPEDNLIALRERERICARNGDFDQALKYNDIRLSRMPDFSTPQRAGVLYDRYVIYRLYMGRPPKDHIECLLESAIYDVVSANQDVASFRYVEAYLNSIGADNEAKKVSDYYYSTIIRLGSRSRLISDAGLNRRINEQYSERLKRRNNEIRFGLLLILLLVALLSLIVIKQIRSRAKIIRLNKDLERSGKTANSYVLGFFQLYSSYISRLQALRSKINTNTRKGNTKYVLDLTDPSKDFTSEELKQMYHNFDQAFLDIFPNFVKDFNDMLLPEHRILPKQGELLNTDLRIFAIIKLGITDSQKISELLHCSIKTVYNKRSGINTRLIVTKEQFAENLAKI